MKNKLTLIELFSGIGAQIKGIENTNLFDTKVIATSDIDKESIVSYASIYKGLTKELIKNYNNYPSEEDMKKELIDKNIGIDLKKGTNSILKTKGEKLKIYWLAMKLSNNLGDISKIEKLPLADIWTYSFPCQDISTVGKQAGIVKNTTRSGLLYEVDRLLENAKEENILPKYLLLENVKNLVSKKFINQFEDWIKRLEELGYNTYYQVLNSKNCGIPQNRNRVFAISIRKDIDTEEFKFPKSFDLGYRLKDFLEKDVDRKYTLSQKGVNFITSPKRGICTDINKPICQTITAKGQTNWTGTFVSEDIEKMKKSTTIGSSVPVKIFLKDGSVIINNGNGINQNLHLRKLTPKECWRLMGFGDEDFEKVKNMGMSDSVCYRQAGNSIVTNCISLIMEHLYKAQYDNNYKCTDESI